MGHEPRPASATHGSDVAGPYADTTKPAESTLSQRSSDESAFPAGEERDELDAELESTEQYADALTVDELFLRVNSVIPEAQQLVTIEPGSSSSEALQLMALRGFSQLPIVRGKRVIGLFSYRSVVLRLRRLNCRKKREAAVCGSFCPSRSR